ncbi:uncharacterized protein LOC110254363 [Exaiptasia diaphana]|uniref:Uncharacterized protein n=1 Tax=Exaiptasia diaphana TaxID=2652724 RepID=A0A913Y9U2_EXADI|nr:uncharacterized protein LOC110254363 [Exaiptasia diaphana]
MRPPTICLQTSTNVGFFIPATGYILSVRLTWQSGVISCNKDKDHCAAYWGCACYDHSKPTSTDTRLDIIITDHNSHKVFPDLKLPDQNDRIWYTLPDQTNEQQVLTFPNLTQPLRVRNGEKFIVWYSTHLLNPGPHWSKADGNVCFSVEVLFSQVDADDDHDPFLR